MGTDGISRREFVKTAGGAAVGTWAADAARRRGSRAPALRDGRDRRARHRHVGTAHRRRVQGRRRVRRPVRHQSAARRGRAKKAMGVNCPTFTNFDEMLDKAKPDLLMVTTVDATHSELHRQGRSSAASTSRPRSRWSSTRRSASRCSTPRSRSGKTPHRHVQLPVRAEAPEDQGTADGRRDRPRDVGRLLLVPRHVARRRLLPALASAAEPDRGSLWVHKATHHFDLINWWLDADPVDVVGVRQACQLRQERAVPPHATAGRARTRASASTTGTSRGAPSSSTSTSTASPPTATSATAACSRKTSTSSTR